MARLEKPVEKREPQSWEEHIVAYLEVADGCATEATAVMPPPSHCGGSVHLAYSVAQFHVLSILFILIFLAFMWGLIMAALKS